MMHSLLVRVRGATVAIYCLSIESCHSYRDAKHRTTYERLAFARIPYANRRIQYIAMHASLAEGRFIGKDYIASIAR
jgi:hypothetical protein